MFPRRWKNRNGDHKPKVSALLNCNIIRGLHACPLLLMIGSFIRFSVTPSCVYQLFYCALFFPICTTTVVQIDSLFHCNTITDKIVHRILTIELYIMHASTLKHGLTGNQTVLNNWSNLHANSIVSLFQSSQFDFVISLHDPIS